MPDPGDPVEGEVASYCPTCHGPCTYHHVPAGWRIYHNCLGPKPRYVEQFQIDPPARTIGEEDL